MNYGMGPEDARPREPVLVYNFNKQSGNDFKVYISLNAPAAVAPCHDTKPAIGGWVCKRRLSGFLPRGRSVAVRRILNAGLFLELTNRALDADPGDKVDRSRNDPDERGVGDKSGKPGKPHDKGVNPEPRLGLISHRSLVRKMMSDDEGLASQSPLFIHRTMS